jgi:hypothetical protein
MADEWRRYTFLGMWDGTAHFAVPQGPQAPGVPGRATMRAADNATGEEPLREAYRHWCLREGWRTLGPDEFAALYDKWLPKRDAILGKEGHLGKARIQWERFYVALADERAAREYAEGRVSLSLGLDGKDLMRAMMAKHGKGFAG